MTVPSTAIRRRVALIASAAVVAAGALAVAGCGGGSEASSAPADTAASYVPAGTPMYFEVTTDAEGPQWTQVRELAQLFPAYPTLVEQLRESLSGEDVDFERDVRPLLGDRAAVAVTSLDNVAEVAALATTSTPDPAADGAAAGEAVGESTLGVIDIADGAREDVEALLTRTGSRADGELRGASVFVDAEGDDTTVVGVTDQVLLVADRREDLSAALEANAAGGEATLAGTDAFTDTLGKLPDEVFGLMYVDVGAIVQAGGEAVPQELQFGSLGDLQDGHVGAAVIAEPEGLRIKGVASGVDAYENAAAFSPSLIANAPADALAYAEISDISGLIEGELAAFRATADPEALEQIDAFAQAIPQILGITVDQLAALGEGQQALIAVPGATPAGMPGIAVLSRVEDGAQATVTLDKIREATPALLGTLGGSEPGAAPNLWRPVPLGNGLRGWQLPLGDDLSVIYAVQGDLVVLGSSRTAVTAVLDPATDLGASPAFTAATAGMPDSVASVAWLNIRAISRVAEAQGAFDDAPPESRANLRPLRNVAYWDAGGDEPAFEAFITIGE